MIHEILVGADYLLAVLVTLCALAHFAILRAPDLQESETIEAVRRIKIGGFTILAMRWWYVLVFEGDMLIPSPTQIGLTLVIGAELYRTVYRLFQHSMDTHQAGRAARRKGDR